jgi:hypothetical protein
MAIGRFCFHKIILVSCKVAHAGAVGVTVLQNRKENLPGMQRWISGLSSQQSGFFRDFQFVTGAVDGD